ncbi:MAG TPA: hypothetical protein VNJ07_00210 [Chitinophagales bacterium]|nr:hypothetical protein [Chitinophagales bacterium]
MSIFLYFHARLNSRIPLLISMHIRVCSCLLPIVLFCCLGANEGCKKEELLTASGAVIYTGTFSSGGCEWIIRIGTALYQPDNLPSAFMVDGLTVEVTYRLVRTKTDCPNPGNYAGVIHLNRIRQI